MDFVTNNEDVFFAEVGNYVTAIKNNANQVALIDRAQMCVEESKNVTEKAKRNYLATIAKDRIDSLVAIAQHIETINTLCRLSQKEPAYVGETTLKRMEELVPEINQGNMDFLHY